MAAGKSSTVNFLAGAAICVALGQILPAPAGAQEHEPGRIVGLEAPSQPFAAGVAAYDRGEFTLARDIWLTWAHTGDPAAQRNLAHLYRMGLGVAQNFAQAASWYRLAADNGLARAQANLAAMYLRGQGVEKDAQQAAYWFTAAAGGGHVLAQYNLALLYLRGQGVERNEAKATGWFYRAAQAGHKPALRALGKLVALVSGPAGPPSAPGPPPARQVRPEVIAKPIKKTMTTPKTDSMDAAALGNTEDKAAPAPTSKSTAEVAPAPSFLEFVASFLSKLELIDSASDAESSLERAPVQAPIGDLAAGLVALHAANFAAARTHWQPLAENGQVEAQYQLGKLYLRPEFTEASNAQSFFWLARAAAQSHPGARAGRDVLDQRMSPDERAAARKMLQTLQSAE
jgi:TPR repeat protein